MNIIMKTEKRHQFRLKILKRDLSFKQPLIPMKYLLMIESNL